MTLGGVARELTQFIAGCRKNKNGFACHAFGEKFILPARSSKYFITMSKLSVFSGSLPKIGIRL